MGFSDSVLVYDDLRGEAGKWKNMEMILKPSNYSYKLAHVFMGGKDRFILTNNLSDHFSFLHVHISPTSSEP